jgi:hypothetical protein
MMGFGFILAVVQSTIQIERVVLVAEMSLQNTTVVIYKAQESAPFGWLARARALSTQSVVACHVCSHHHIF